MKRKMSPAVVVLGMLIVIAAGLFAVEWLVVPDIEPVPVDRPEPPTPPVVRKIDDETIVVEFASGSDSTSTIRGDTDFDLDAVVACMQERIGTLFEREVPPRGRRLKREVDRIQQECVVGLIDR